MVLGIMIYLARGVLRIWIGRRRTLFEMGYSQPLCRLVSVQGTHPQIVESKPGQTRPSDHEILIPKQKVIPRERPVNGRVSSLFCSLLLARVSLCNMLTRPWGYSCVPPDREGRGVGWGQ